MKSRPKRRILFIKKKVERRREEEPRENEVQINLTGKRRETAGDRVQGSCKEKKRR